MKRLLSITLALFIAINTALPINIVAETTDESFVETSQVVEETVEETSEVVNEEENTTELVDEQVIIEETKDDDSLEVIQEDETQEVVDDFNIVDTTDEETSTEVEDNIEEIVEENEISEDIVEKEKPMMMLSLSKEPQEKASDVGWKSTNLTYNGEKQHPDVKSNSLFYGVRNVTYEISGDGVDVGEYSVTAKGELYVLLSNTSKGNFTVSTTYTIGKKNIDLDWEEFASLTQTATKTYDGTNMLEGYHPTSKDIVSDDKDKVAIGVDLSEAKDVGTYTLTAILSGKKAGNYNIQNLDKSRTLKITAKDVSINWGTTSFTYNREDQINNFNPTVTGLIEGDDVSAVINKPGRAIGADEYTVSVSLDGTKSGNYKLPTTTSKKYEITKKPVTLTWCDNELPYIKGYDYAQKEMIPTVNGVIEGDDAKISISLYKNLNKVSKAEDKGIYRVTASLGNNNYKISGSDDKTITIAQGRVALVWPNQKTYTYKSDSYNDTFAPKAYVTVGLSQVEASDAIKEITIKDKDGYPVIKPTSAGTYKVEVTIDDNYTLYSGDKTETFTIAPKELSIDWGTDEFTYNGQEQQTKFEPTLKGVQGSDNVSIRTTKNEDAINYGDYDVEVTIVGNEELLKNYTLPTCSHTYTINKKNITLDWGKLNYSTTYETYNGEDHLENYTVTSSDICEDDTQIETSITDADGASARAVDAGTYTISVSLTGDAKDNYAITNAGPKYLKVNQKVVTPNWGKYNQLINNTTYDGTNKLKGYSLTTDDFVSGDEGNVSLKLNLTEAINADTYELKASLDGDRKDNYQIKDGNASRKLVINKVTLTPNWDKYSSTSLSENTIIYDGVDHYIEGEFIPTLNSGVVYGEDVKLKAKLQKTKIGEGILVDVTSAKDSGSYTVSVSLDGEDISNYNLVDTLRQITINKKNVWVTWNTIDSSLAFYNGNSHINDFKPLCYSDEGKSKLIEISPKVTLTNYNNVAVTEETSDDIKEAIIAGDYTMKVEFDEGYNVFYLNGSSTHTYTVNKKPLSLTWNPITTYVYDGNNKYNTFTPSLNGVVGRDSDYINLDIKVNNNTVSEIKNAGTYNVKANVVAVEDKEDRLSNYTMPLVDDVTYKITKKPLYIDWISYTGHDYIYNGQPHADYFKPNVYSNEDLSDIVTMNDVVTLSFTAKDHKGTNMSQTDADVAIKAGTYTVTATLNDSDNYVLMNTASHTYTIARKPFYVRWLTIEGHDYIYNGQSHSTYFVPKAYKNSDFSIEEDSSLITSIELIDAKDPNKESMDITKQATKDAKLAGSYTYKIHFDSDNYDLKSSSTHTYDILQRQLSYEWLTWDTSIVHVYDSEKEYCFIPELLNDVSADNLTTTAYINGNKVDNDSKVKDADTYVVTMELDDNDALINYNKPAVKTFTFIIGKKPLYVDWISYTGHNYIYDETSHADYFEPNVYTNSTKTIVEKNSGIVSFDIIDAKYTNSMNMTVEDRNAAIKAGTYTVKASIPNTDNQKNYEIVNINESHTYVIAKRVVRVEKINLDYDYTYTYNEEVQGPNDIAFYNAITNNEITSVTNDDYTVINTRDSLTKNPCDPINVGSYLADVVLDYDFYLNNCFATDSKYGLVRFIINPRLVEFVSWKDGDYTLNNHKVTWKDGKATYDSYILATPEANFIYSDTKQAVEAGKLVKGLDKDYKVTTTKDFIRNADNYDAYVASNIGSNYLIVNHVNKHTLTVEPKEVKIVWTKTSIDIQDEDKRPGYVIDGLCDNDYVTVDKEKLPVVGIKLWYDGKSFCAPADAGHHTADFIRFTVLFNDGYCYNYKLANDSSKGTSYVILDHTTIKTDGNISVGTLIEDAPINELTMDLPGENGINELLEALNNSSKESDQELASKISEALDDGKNVNIYLKATKCENTEGEQLPVAEDKIALFDISLYACIDGDDVEYKITETGDYFVSMHIKINEQEANRIGVSPTRDNFVVRYHEDEKPSIQKVDSPIITGVAPEREFEFIFYSNKFSTYGIYTSEIPEEDNSNPKARAVPNTSAK